MSAAPTPEPQLTSRARRGEKAQRGASVGGASAGGGYTARHLSVLEGLEAVRKRPGMYVGSTDSRGLTHCLWEIIDNSVDEALAGYATRIQVELVADGSFIVTDNGRGVPVDVEPRTGLTGVEVVFTKLHAGGKFGGGSYAVSGGLHGVGASVVNALSSRLDVVVERDGHAWAMSFARGEPGTFDDPPDGPGPTSPFHPFTATPQLRSLRRVARTVTGTTVRFWPDRQIFTPDATVSYDELVERAQQTAFLVPGLRVEVRDAREAEPQVASFVHQSGIGEFVEALAPDRPVSSVVRLGGSGSFTETVPVLDDRGRLVSTEVTRECQVDVALRWGEGYDTVVRSFVNVITTPHGGTHLAGFEQALVKTVRRQVELNARRLRPGSDRPDKEDVMEGLTAVVAVRLAEPQFEGQTKEVLGTPAVRGIVAKVVERELTAWFSSTRRGERAQAMAVLDKVVAAMRARLAVREHRETQRRKNALEASSLPAKLADCRSDDVERTELFIVEGDSALGTAKLARDSEFQALLPIRGKILNVQKASAADMLRNAECAAIVQVLGAGVGHTFDLSAARYGRVIFMSDADVDGAHIRTLLLTLFFRYLRPMVEAGRVFAAVPPLHRVEVLNPGHPPEYRYTYSDAQLRSVLADLARRGRRYREPIQRYKGLGEMDADQLAETTMDPRRRTLRRVTLSDVSAAERVFELLMGADVAPRRDFIVEQGHGIDRARIDA